MTITMISRSNVLAGIERIRQKGVPARRRSNRYFLVHNGRKYPPKYVVSLAVEEATGKALAPEKFSGGVETNSLLKGLGFTVDGARTSPLSLNRTRTKHRRSQRVGILRVVVRGVPADAARGERLLL
jgi:hypothetical protein